MNPRCKIPCDMNGSSTKMLQIPGKMRDSNSKMLQNAVEMAVSSSNAANSKGNGQERRYKKRTQNRKKQSQNNFGPRHEPWWAMNHALVWLHPITQLRFACRRHARSSRPTYCHLGGAQQALWVHHKRGEFGQLGDSLPYQTLGSDLQLQR